MSFIESDGHRLACGGEGGEQAACPEGHNRNTGYTPAEEQSAQDTKKTVEESFQSSENTDALQGLALDVILGGSIDAETAADLYARLLGMTGPVNTVGLCASVKGGWGVVGNVSACAVMTQTPDGDIVVARNESVGLEGPGPREHCR